MAAVELLGVRKVFAGLRSAQDTILALDRFSLRVDSGELLALVGPSGSGKTTALRVIAGFEDVSDGEVRIAGHCMRGVPPRKRNVALTLQNFALYPHLSVYDNMRFGLQGAGRWRRQAQPSSASAASWETRIRELASCLEIEELLQRMPWQLSGGQQQRVALARALVRQPDAWLLDEPLSNLDGPLRAALRRKLKEVQQASKVTTVYVTHDQTEALALGDRVAVVWRGTVQQVGTPQEVYDWPVNRLVAGLVGSPQMNFIEGELVRPGGSADSSAAAGAVTFRRGAWSLPLAPRRAQRLRPGTSGPAVLGIRPSDVWVRQGEAATRAKLRGTIRWLEPTGEAVIGAVDVGDTMAEGSGGSLCIQFSVGRHAGLAAGRSVGLEFNAERLHAFDVRSGKSLMESPANG